VPITFYADKWCASAGVYLGTTTGDFQASTHAEVGSIGVIAVYTDYTEMYKQMGITKRVFKSTPLKGYGNPNEKLSDEAVKEINANIAESNSRFIDHVALGLGLSTSFVAENLANGKMWYADQAKQLGLITGITTFDNLLVDLQQKVNQNSNQGIQGASGTVALPQTNKLSEADMAKKKMAVLTSEQALALAASGVPVDLEQQELDNENNGRAESAEGADSSADAAVTGAESGESSAGAEAHAEAETAETQASLATLLSEANKDLTNTKVSLALSERSLAETQARLVAVEKPLKDIVAIAVQRLQVSIGSAPTELAILADMDAVALATQFSSLDAALAKRLGSGGRVSLKSEDLGEESESDLLAGEAAKYADRVLAPLVKFSTK
jgi:hypothetical protein